MRLLNYHDRNKGSSILIDINKNTDVKSLIVNLDIKFEEITLSDNEFKSLKNIDVNKLQNYLISTRWIKGYQSKENNAAYWSNELYPNNRLLILLDKSYGDYIQKLREVIECLAYMENRLQSEILQEIINYE